MLTKILNEFKTFIARGNVIDLAVGIVIGAAFTAIVKSLVTDVVNPILGLISGGMDFSNHFLSLDGRVYQSIALAKEAGAPVLAWGSFITAIINFLIVAWAVFLLIKLVNKLEDIVSGDEDVAEAITEPTKSPSVEELLIEIRDELKLK
ncbi:large conductance mechanosensitive channel protein MscL [uncultured Planktomarina sp.]|jgi:large conductance mechanosensitive channel|uniref:large conductance mechanosensitive channel protein MscL n=1 Tax=uncultured Planktomarina sp. TaxID=1538529 RepID=UPI0032615F77|tara:strand:+ start:303 stop:749 length:447 start_codon:yes stop_codon:yes gene_type:complete